MRLLVLMAGLWLAAFSSAVADEGRARIGPEIPKASGDPHPEGNAYMRRYHMDMMRHDRDVTMYDGVRDIDASLAECFECHTVRDEAGTPVTYADERHYCRTCHDYAAVKVDCFDCHRSTPADFEEPALHASRRLSPVKGETDAPEVLHAYIDGLTTIGTEAQE